MPLIVPTPQGRGKPQPGARLITGGINSRCIGAWLLGEGGPQWADSSQQNRRLYIYSDNSAGGYQEAAPWAKGRLSGLAYRTTGFSKTYLRTDRSYSASSSSNLTVNFWVYFIGFTDYYIQMSQWDEPANKRAWEIWTFGDGTIHASSSSNGADFHREDGPALSLGRWYMITATFPTSGGTLKIFVNGAAVSTTSAGNQGYSGFLNTAQPIYFGYSPGTAGTGAKGSNQKMEAVSIWERVLADDEIAGLYRDQFRQWERPRLRRSLGGIITAPAYQYSRSPQAQRATYIRQ